jgi:hypothetical protein
MTDMKSELAASIRSIPDYPKPGIIFRDITTLLGDARAFRRAVDELVQNYAGMKIDKIAGMEARGFILGGAVAHQLSAGFVPIRKKGKLPHETVRIAYSLEYGVDEMEMHVDAVISAVVPSSKSSASMCARGWNSQGTNLYSNSMTLLSKRMTCVPSTEPSQRIVLRMRPGRDACGRLDNSVTA